MTDFHSHPFKRHLEMGLKNNLSDIPVSTSPDTLSSYPTSGLPTPQLDEQALAGFDFSMFDPNQLPDPYFTDSYSADPLFLGDLDSFEPQLDSPLSASTSKKSPSPTSSMDRIYKLSPTSSPNDNFPSTSPLENLSEEENDFTEVLKRQRGSQPDNISACWQSPICPQYNKRDGTPPSPSKCDGGCAPFLFANEPLPETALDTSIFNVEIAPEPEEKPIEQLRTASKRSEAEASTDTPSQAGRRVQKVPASSKMRKSTSSERESIAKSIEEPETKGKKRVPHNEVERKYRDSVNNQMDCLRRVVPVLQTPRICEGADIEDIPTPATKPSKAVILASATAYIKHMEKEKKELEEKNAQLQARLKALQNIC